MNHLTRQPSKNGNMSLQEWDSNSNSSQMSRKSHHQDFSVPLLRHLIYLFLMVILVDEVSTLPVIALCIEWEIIRPCQARSEFCVRAQQHQVAPQSVYTEIFCTYNTQRQPA